MAILTVKNLCVKVKDKNIIDGVDFEVNAGEVVALTGMNGSGKSTILKAIIGDCGYGDVSGEINYLDGDNILKQKDRQWFNRAIGYVEQEDIFATDTPYNEVEYSLKLFAPQLANRKYIEELFEFYGVSHLKNKRLNGRQGTQLSGGEKKMVSLLTAIARKEAKLFIIDEPLNNLDIKNIKFVSNMITKLHNENPEVGILMVTHCHVFPCVTKMLTLENGKIVPNEEEYVCHNCFGRANDEGYYE